MVFMRSLDFALGLGLHIHIRTTRRFDYSFISGVAMKVGDDILEVETDGSLIINGILVTAADEDDDLLLSLFSPSYPLTKTLKGSNKSITVYNITLSSKTGDLKSVQIRLNSNLGMFFVDVQGIFPDSEGLLGNPAKVDHGLMARDGVTNLDGHWNTYGEEWQVRKDEEALFRDRRFPQHPAGCRYEEEDNIKNSSTNKKKNKRRRRLMTNTAVTTTSVDEDAATEACSRSRDDKKRDFCIQDVVATGNLELAEDPFYLH